MKTIVTHISPDLDAIGSSWLVKKFFPDWQDAQLAYVSAGLTLDSRDPDADQDIIHVDTGLGQFDHHQLDDPHKQYCATKLVFDHAIKHNYIKEDLQEALTRMVKFITAIDHFGELYLTDPNADVYDFTLHQILEGIRAVRITDEERSHFGFIALESVLNVMRQKVQADEDIKQGFVFDSKWGKALALETKNSQSMKIALKTGFRLVITRSPEYGTMRIKSHPVPEIDLTPVYEKIIKQDPHATWFLHNSKHMVLNGSVKRPDNVPSHLNLPQIVEIIRKIA